jgi:hypothetical protein
MAAMLDLTKIRKSYLPVRLPDGSVINVGTPNKGMYDELTRIDPILANLKDDSLEDTLEAMEITFDYVARVMSNNKENREITPEFVRDELEIDGALAVMYAFADFINAKRNVEAKN